MVYTFKITSQESKNFLLEVKIDGQLSFFDLHSVIQLHSGFEPFQVASFFLTDEKGFKTKEISMMDAGFNGGAYFLMQKTKLADLIKIKEQRLYYTFDFLDDRSFYIELTGIDMGTTLKDPLVTIHEGDAPVQVLTDEMEKNPKEKLQEEEVFMDFGILDDYNELFGEMEDF